MSHILRCSWVGNKHQHLLVSMLGLLVGKKGVVLTSKTPVSFLAGWVDAEGWACAGKMSHNIYYFHSLEGMVVENFSAMSWLVAAMERISVLQMKVVLGWKVTIAHAKERGKIHLEQVNRKQNKVSYKPPYYAWLLKSTTFMDIPGMIIWGSPSHFPPTQLWNVLEGTFFFQNIISD